MQASRDIINMPHLITFPFLYLTVRVVEYKEYKVEIVVVVPSSF